MHQVILVSKVPTAKLSKTRLIESSTSLKSKDIEELTVLMLKDVLNSFSQLNNESFILDWFFWPPTYNIEALEILQECNLENRWNLLPNFCQEKNLGLILRYILETYRNPKAQVVTLIGSDIPHLSPTECLNQSYSIPNLMIKTEKDRVYICPGDFIVLHLHDNSFNHCILAYDGGYCLISLPSNHPQILESFNNIRWSCQYTMEDQIATLQELGFEITFGNKYHDIDTFDDIQMITNFIINDQMENQTLEAADDKMKEEEEYFTQKEKFFWKSNAHLTTTFLLQNTKSLK